MIPYSPEKSSVSLSEKDGDYLNNSFLPPEPETYGFEIYYPLDDVKCEEYSMDLFTFLLDENDVVSDEQLFFYWNGGNQDSPVIIREAVNSIWGFPVESDGVYIRINKVPEKVKTIMIAGFLYQANERNQKLQELETIHWRLFAIDENYDDGKTLYQHTIFPGKLGDGKYGIMIFAKLVRIDDDWKFVVLNEPVQDDPYEFIRKYGIE